MSSSYNQGFPSDTPSLRRGTRPYHMQQQQQPPGQHQGQRDGVPNLQEPPIFHPTTGHTGSQSQVGLNSGSFPLLHPQGDTHRQTFQPPLNFHLPPPSHLPPPPDFHGLPPANYPNFPPPPLPNQRYLPPRPIGPHPLGFPEVSPTPPALIPNEESKNQYNNERKQYHMPFSHQPGKRYHDPQVDNVVNFDEQVRNVPPENIREKRGSSDGSYRDISQYFNLEGICSKKDHPKGSDQESTFTSCNPGNTSRRFSPTRSRSAGKRSPRRSRSPQQKSLGRSRSPGKKSPRRSRSPQQKSLGRSRSPGKKSPRRSRSPQQKSLGRSRSPGKRSPRRSRSPQQKSLGRSRSPGKKSPRRSRSPQQRSLRRSRSPRQRSPKRSRSPRRRSPQQSRSSRRSPTRQSRSTLRSNSPHQRQPSKERSRRPRSPYHDRSRKESSRRSQSPKKSRSLTSPDRGKTEDNGKEAESRRPRKRSPVSQTTRWNDLEAKTAALEELQIPINLSADKEDKKEDRNTMDDEPAWIQCSPKGNFYSTDPKMQKGESTVAATDKLKDLLSRFQEEIVNRGVQARENQPKLEIPQPKVHWHVHKGSDGETSEEDTDSSSSSDEEEEEEKEQDDPLAFLKVKEKHPARLAENLWFNDPGEVNDGPLCRCSNKAKQVGIRHNIYPGEKPIPLCDPYTNNAGKLYHYRITLAPSTNFLTHQPTVIEYDDREYIFEGFSLFSHVKLDNIPPCKVVRFNIEYSILFIEEPMPENFSVKGLDLFVDFLFFEILELYDFELVGKVGGCRLFHFMPRFARHLPSNGKEILSMHHVVQNLLKMSRPIIEEKDLKSWLECDQITWERYAEEHKGMIVTCPGKKPSSVRVDQVDREDDTSLTDESTPTYPTIVHFGLRPAQLSYAGNRDYQNLFKSYLKMNHLLANKPKVSLQDRQKLAEKEKKLQRIRLQGHMTREVTAEISSKDMLMTGIGSDVCQHAMMLPVLVNHMRYFNCLYNIDDIIGYKFKDRVLLKHAMTHPSYRLTYGMNPDHVRNSLYNCGIRQPDYGDKKKQVERSRKKGINTLIKIMSEMAAPDELSSHIHHYERLEFLGDAVVEFVTSTHLYYLFPPLEEGGLATYRQAIVQNQHLAVLARKLELERFLLYAHGPDLCRSSDLKHALANCLEALMGALFLEGGLPVVRRIFCNLLFDTDKLRRIWMDHPKHPLQLEFPQGDRHMIQYSSILQMLSKFEESTGIKFNHIRLLARAFTQRTMSYTNLTRGHNQRMEFLGDTVLQLITSNYLYKHFPNHHEGHLSLLRSSLVNNKTQAMVASDLGMSEYIIDAKNRTLEDGGPLPTKLLADLLEAFVGAMFVDQGIESVTVFCGVCFFPRLKDFIYSQHWNDAKSQLQQCCLTLRTEGKEPDVPQYKVISQHGPTNNRVYNVAVYFRNKRLGTGCASNTQDAQMEAAKDALQNYNFPQLHHQRMVVERKYNEDSKEYGKGSNPRQREMGENLRRREMGGNLRQGEAGGSKSRHTRDHRL